MKSVKLMVLLLVFTAVFGVAITYLALAAGW